MVLPVPFSDEQSKAATAAAKAGQTVVEEGGALARYIGRVLGTVPEDAVGLLIGDPLRAIRTRNAARLHEWVEADLKRRGIGQVEAVSPSLAVPLLSAAYDESRPELQRLWAQLIAAAMDPGRSGRVRLSYIETIRKMDPLDALLLKTMQADTMSHDDTVGIMAERMKCGPDEVEVSAINLTGLGLLHHFSAYPRRYTITTYGREFLRTVGG